MAGRTIQIDHERCKKCGLCVEICPEGLFVRPGPKTYPHPVRVRQCIDCGHCVSVCPNGAVIHSSFPDDDWLDS